jgi:hypothetical protein
MRTADSHDGYSSQPLPVVVALFKRWTAAMADAFLLYFDLHKLMDHSADSGDPATDAPARVVHRY